MAGLEHLAWQDRLPRRAVQQLGDKRPDGFFGPVFMGTDVRREEAETVALVEQIKILQKQRGGEPLSVDEIFDELGEFIKPRRD